MCLSLPALDNLVRAGKLKAEPRNDAEVGRLLAMARTRLADARLAGRALAGARCGAPEAQLGRVRRCA